MPLDKNLGFVILTFVRVHRLANIAPTILVNLPWIFPQLDEGFALFACLGVLKRLVVGNFAFLFIGHIWVKEKVDYCALVIKRVLFGELEGFHQLSFAVCLYELGVLGD